VSAKVFLSYGYNERDRWIEQCVVPILKALGLELLDGKDMHGEVLQEAVRERLRQSDGLIAFCTLRPGHETEAFNTHVWVRDEMVFALGLGLPVVEVREEGVVSPPGIVGDRQRILLRQGDRLACVAELATVVSGWCMRKLQLVFAPQREAEIRSFVRNPQFEVSYRIRRRGVDSAHRRGRLERITGGLYMQVRGLPDDALIEIEGVLNGQVVFSSDWEAVDAVQIAVY